MLPCFSPAAGSEGGSQRCTGIVAMARESPGPGAGSWFLQPQTGAAGLVSQLHKFIVMAPHFLLMDGNRRHMHTMFIAWRIENVRYS